MACTRAPLGLQHGHHACTIITLPMTVPLKKGRSWVSSYGGAQRTPVCAGRKRTLIPINTDAQRGFAPSQCICAAQFLFAP